MTTSTATSPITGIPGHEPIRALSPFAMQDVKVLLLENVHACAQEILSSAGFQVEFHTKSMSEEDLLDKIQDVHVIGIRSKTKMSKAVLRKAKKLLAIGCFCIGTNQVDLEEAAARGIAVFNSPFSNSRSVAEMTIAYTVNLSRRAYDRNNEMHQGGIWRSETTLNHEIRGKTLGIVGYGHIGSQLSVLAEAMGMRVIYYDVLERMPLGNATPQASLDVLLAAADVVTLHVPERPDTRRMIAGKEMRKMRKGAYLINASRGTVVDLEDLKVALNDGHLGGAAVDVYPREPVTNGCTWWTGLESTANVILTPHVGGCTEEAQRAIGEEVATALKAFLVSGASVGAVQFPEIALKRPTATHVARILNVHRNVPGVLKQINKKLTEYEIQKQTCDSLDDIAYLAADICLPTDPTAAEAEVQRIYAFFASVPESILTRILH